MRLEHAVELVLEDRRAEREDADHVVELAEVHVEEAVLRGAVEHAEVLVDEQVLVELDVLQLDVVHVAVEARVQRDERVHEVRRALLVEERDEARAADHRHRHHLLPADGVRGELAVLGEDLLELAGDLLHRDVLRVRADARHREPDVDRRPLPAREELRVEVDLAVGDRDDVRDDVRRDVVRERLDDGQRGERAAAAARGEHRGALEEARVQVEDVAGVRLAAGRAAQQQRELAVRDGLLREVVVHDEAVAAAVHEVLAHRDAGVRREELEAGGLGGGRGHDRRVAQRAVRVEEAVDARDVRAALADGDVDREHGVLREDLLVDADLVDDRRDRERRLAGLPVADDELALPAADGDERVDGLEAGEQVVVDRRARDDVRRVRVDAAELVGHDVARLRGVAVEAGGDLLAERVHDLAEHVEAARDREQLARRHDLLAGLDLGDVVHEDEPDAAVLLEVEDEAARDDVRAHLDLDDRVVRDALALGRRDDGRDRAVDRVDVADEVAHARVRLRLGHRRVAAERRGQRGAERPGRWRERAAEALHGWNCKTIREGNAVKGKEFERERSCGYRLEIGVGDVQEVTMRLCVDIQKRFVINSKMCGAEYIYSR